MKATWTRILAGAALLVLVTCGSGCRTVVVSEGNRNSYQLERSFRTWETYVNATVPEAQQAVLAALQELQLRPYRSRTDMISAVVKGAFADGMSYDLALEFTAPSVTRVSIRCGFWGDETRSILLFKGIERQLQAHTAAPPPAAPW